MEEKLKNVKEQISVKPTNKKTKKTNKKETKTVEENNEQLNKSCESCENAECKNKQEPKNTGKKINDVIKKKEPKILTVEDFQYFKKLGDQEVDYIKRIAFFEVQKVDMIDRLKQLSVHQKTFEKQIYEKYELDQNYDFRINPQTREIIIVPKNPTNVPPVPQK